MDFDGGTMPLVENYMYTFNSLHEYPFLWTIDNFTRTPRVFQGLPFCPIPGMAHEFCLEMEFVMPTMVGTTRTSYLYIYLRKLDVSKAAFNVECNIALRNTERETLIKLKSGVRAVGERTLLVNVDWKGYPKNEIGEVYAKVGNNYFLLQKDRLVVEGILIFAGFLNNSIKSSLIDVPSSKDREDLLKDLKAMYSSGLESDITIRIGDKTIFAIKGILCGRSPVFRKMFDHSMQESRSNIIDIEDVEFHVFDCFIMYLYTGEIEDKTCDTVLSLYSVADKYEVKSLQSSCSRILGSSLTVKSVLSVLLLSALHNDEELKNAAKIFISWHFKEVGGSSEWVDIVATNPQLASEILNYLTALQVK